MTVLKAKMEARVALERLNVAVGVKATDFVQKIEASESEDCVLSHQQQY